MDPKQLISAAFKIPSLPQNWAELGSGAGVFTYALAELLPEGSQVFAFDKVSQYFDTNRDGVQIGFRKLDFQHDDLGIQALDGILMANSLHYVKDKSRLIEKLDAYLKPDSKKFLIVEYDTDRSNPWVPYPIRYERLKQQFADLGYGEAVKVGEQASKYGGKIYAAFVSI